MLRLMRQPLQSWQSTEYADNRISLFSAQWGKCAVTGKEFECLKDIHCHHRKPRKQNGGDEYKNLILVLEPIHRLIHSTDENTIRAILKTLSLDAVQMRKLNALRKAAELKTIA
jgi:5-methylcytosine-specific restriction endonuclease McrA